MKSNIIVTTFEGPNVNHKFDTLFLARKFARNRGVATISYDKDGYRCSCDYIFGRTIGKSNKKPIDN